MLALRLSRRPIPPSLWAWMAVVLFYWVTMGAAARPAEGMRYVFFGAVGVLLLAAESVAGRIGKRMTAGAVVIALLALPANIAQLRSGSDDDTLHHDARVSRAEFAMLELAGSRVEPEYVASADPNVAAAGGGLFIGIPAAAYLRSVQRNGSAAFTLEELSDQPEELRRIADVTLADAIALEPTVVGRPADAARCPVVSPRPGSGVISFPLPPGRTVFGPASGRPVKVGLRRFADGQSGELEEVPAGGWRSLAIPRDAAPQPWRGVADAPLRVCFRP
jgi:hypothetical protein